MHAHFTRIKCKIPHYSTALSISVSQNLYNFPAQSKRQKQISPFLINRRSMVFCKRVAKLFENYFHIAAFQNPCTYVGVCIWCSKIRYLPHRFRTKTFQNETTRQKRNGVAVIMVKVWPDSLFHMYHVYPRFINGTKSQVELMQLGRFAGTGKERQGGMLSEK